MEMPSFLITIDTEGDNVWESPEPVGTENARFLPRFQDLCDRHGLKPTYLTNYEMAVRSDFVAFARDALARGTAEIGMHLHAWNSPPFFELKGAAANARPYLVEYPDDVVRDKVAYMTKLLRETFDCPVTSHRSGRWALNSTYAHILKESGFRVDCSVTPHIDWGSSMGAFSGGSNYTRFPDTEYFLDLDHIRQAGSSVLLELPVTVVDFSPRGLDAFTHRNADKSLVKRALRRLWPIAWLRPNGRNVGQMKRIVDRAVVERRRYLEFMLHSSELMPGGSPTFRTAESIERLYEDLECLFSYIAGKFSGATLAEYRDAIGDERTHAGK